jgi:hypothetical protein
MAGTWQVELNTTIRSESPVEFEFGKGPLPRILSGYVEEKPSANGKYPILFNPEKPYRELSLSETDLKTMKIFFEVSGQILKVNLYDLESLYDISKLLIELQEGEEGEIQATVHQKVSFF